MDDYNFNEEDGRYAPPRQAPVYDPGPNWNGGVPPGPPAPRYDYNNGSPVDQPLTPGYGWEWHGPQTPEWDQDTKQWNYGVWDEAMGRGLGYVDSPNTTPGPPPPPPTNGGGRVPPMGGGINVPSSTLPGDIQGVFNTPPTKTPIQSMYQDALLKFMSQSQETPSLEDGILRPQSEVYRVSQQRNQERSRRSAVERAAATGLSGSGGLGRKIDRGIQEQNFNTAQYNANLLGSELNRRRESLLAALSLASQTGNSEATRELQKQLAEVSAKMQQQSLNLQGQLGMGDLDLRWALGTEGLNQNALQLIMNGTR